MSKKLSRKRRPDRSKSGAKERYEAWHASPDAQCPACGLQRTKDGHDPCIANLPGVKFACCGHGFQNGYVSFDNGVVLRGYFEARDRGTVITCIPMNPVPEQATDALFELGEEERERRRVFELWKEARIVRDGHLKYYPGYEIAQFDDGDHCYINGEVRFVGNLEHVEEKLFAHLVERGEILT